MLLQQLQSIPDPRRPQARQYDLPHVLLFSILAVASGATSLRRMADFIHTHLPRLRELYGCSWRQAPSHTSLYTIFSRLDPMAVEQALSRHAQQLIGQNPSQEGCFIALDGKSLRGSLDRLDNHQAAQILSALALDKSLVLGQVGILHSDKNGEIAAAQQLIAQLGLKGCVFTLDALHTQKKRCRSSRPAVTI